MAAEAEAAAAAAAAATAQRMLQSFWVGSDAGGSMVLDSFKRRSASVYGATKHGSASIRSTSTASRTASFSLSCGDSFAPSQRSLAAAAATMVESSTLTSGSSSSSRNSSGGGNNSSGVSTYSCNAPGAFGSSSSATGELPMPLPHVSSARLPLTSCRVRDRDGNPVRVRLSQSLGGGGGAADVVIEGTVLLFPGMHARAQLLVRGGEPGYVALRSECVEGAVSGSSASHARRYELPQLPRPYRQLYALGEATVRALRARTPRFVLSSCDGTAALMEDGPKPTFEVSVALAAPGGSGVLLWRAAVRLRDQRLLVLPPAQLLARGTLRAAACYMGGGGGGARRCIGRGGGKHRGARGAATPRSCAACACTALAAPLSAALR